ncbi:ParB/RepB/Spo0J family partition protein [Janibacter cremeus]|uniref:ParB family chromosome partitioning protein n=1 Tax=Janibacter cremeus TaxID=1285192 RepID=A0A852VS30_9MICO|nr:ParB/RepB/Spo0J family partition protein [Janibacter cremeus]NYF98240.1 ParB family chromosome partitioning protein [Janibacter cremeus]
MSEKRRGLGRGLGALIPDATTAGRPVTERPIDVWFRDQDRPSVPHTAAGMVADADVVADGSSEVPASSSDPAESRPTTDPNQPAAPGPGEPAQDEPATRAESAGQEEPGLAPVPGASYGEIPVAAIRPNPKQPRRVFDEDDMAELVQSIEQIGVLQPIVVRRVEPDDGVEFELIMGERRWRASRDAQRETIPAIVRTTEDEDLLRDALLENLHRSNLNPLEEAAAYRQLLDDFGCSQEELSKRIGRSRPQISNTLRLLRLPPMVARRVAAGVLSAGHARALLTLEDGSQMEHLAQRIVAEGLSVRTVEEIVALGVEPESPARSASPGRQERDAQLDDLAGRISDRFDTRVKIDLGKRKGRMTIEFASREDLHRVLGQMGVDPDEG